MIVARLSGGLGNQFFQYAAARRLANVHKAELLLESSWFGENCSRTTARGYELFRYPIAARLMTKQDVRWPSSYTGKILKRLPLPRRLRLYRETDFRFDPAVLRLPDQVFLDGYWQSQGYFSDVAEMIRAELTPTISMGAADGLTAEMILGTNSIAVHVRRGDYVTLSTAARTHGTCSLDYYREAIRVVSAKTESPSFFVFSDEPDWCRSNLRIDGPTQYVTHNTADAAFQDLRLMSMCRHQIIANSSFSWWGAWLNVNRTKIVIAPKRWFLTFRDSSDLIPDAWLRI